MGIQVKKKPDVSGSDEKDLLNKGDDIGLNEDDSKSNEKDYFTFTVTPDGDFVINHSTNFDQTKFVEELKKSIETVSDDKLRHKIKVFVTKLFRIPMGDLVSELSDDQFVERIDDATKHLNTVERSPNQGALLDLGQEEEEDASDTEN